MPSQHTGFETLIGQGLEALSVPTNNKQLQALVDYAELLMKWNKTHNLTAITDRNDIVAKHFLDSLSILPHLPEGDVIDIGTGAGFPGLPIALFTDNRDVTLLDSSSKRVSFLLEVKRKLALTNIHPVQARVERFAEQTEHRFNIITSRAFSSLIEMVEVSRNLLAEGGYWFAMKGRLPEQEIEQLPETVRLERVEIIEVPGLDAERHLLVMRAI